MSGADCGGVLRGYAATKTYVSTKSSAMAGL